MTPSDNQPSAAGQPGVAGDDVRDALRTFVHTRFPMARSRGTGDSDSLLDAGIVDSLGILDIVAHLEERFGITVGDEDLNPENFDTVDALAAFVASKTV